LSYPKIDSNCGRVPVAGDMYATLTRTKSGISSSAALLMCLGFGSAMAIGNRLLQKTKIVCFLSCFPHRPSTALLVSQCFPHCPSTVLFHNCSISMHPNLHSKMCESLVTLKSTIAGREICSFSVNNNWFCSSFFEHLLRFLFLRRKLLGENLWS
jgi:hypothetical protein